MIEGLIAAPLTPMNTDGSLRLDVIGRQAEFLARNGVKGAFVCGSTGESLSLTVQERMQVAERWVKEAQGDFKVIVHVGHNSLDDGKALAKHAEKTGAWGTGAMGPCFFKPGNQADLIAFCGGMAASAPGLPFFYYHIPGLTGVRLPMREFMEGAADRIPNFRGIKYTDTDLMDFSRCLSFDNGRFDVLFGTDELLICGLALGAKGAVGSTYNFAAPLYLELMEAFQKGELDKARALQRKSIDMIHLLVKSPWPQQAAMKVAMKTAGIDCGPVRLPLRNLTKTEEKELLEGLNQLGFKEFRSS